MGCCGFGKECCFSLFTLPTNELKSPDGSEARPKHRSSCWIAKKLSWFVAKIFAFLFSMAMLQLLNFGKQHPEYKGLGGAMVDPSGQGAALVVCAGLSAFCFLFFVVMFVVISCHEAHTFQDTWLYRIMNNKSPWMIEWRRNSPAREANKQRAKQAKAIEKAQRKADKERMKGQKAMNSIDKTYGRHSNTEMEITSGIMPKTNWFGVRSNEDSRPSFNAPAPPNPASFAYRSNFDLPMEGRPDTRGRSRLRDNYGDPSYAPAPSYSPVGRDTSRAGALY